MALYDTVANIVSDVAVECGLGTVSDVYASTDENVVQMRTLLKSVGRGLIQKNEWLQTTKEHTFVTTSATSYAMPADYASFVDQSAWNRTTDRPILPVSPQEWQYLKTGAETSTINLLFRPRDTTIDVWPQPPNSGDTIAFEYRSRYWVGVSASTAPDKDAPTLNTDKVYLDVQLITRALKWHFLKDKGFGSAEAYEDYKAAYLDVVAMNVGAAPVLSLRPRGISIRPGDAGFAVGATGFGFNNEGGLY